MSDLTWHLETRKLSDLRPHPSNPRKMSRHDAAQLETSLDRYGVAEPPVINTDNTIIGGHMRIKTLKRMGVKEAECLVPSRTLTDKEVAELNIRLNRNAGEWDWEVLANEWELGELLEWGFEAGEIGLDDSGRSDESEADETREPPPNPKTVPGDVYELGAHRVVCGDSTQADVVEKCLNGQTPNLMVTDPPYGVNYDASWRTKLKSGKIAVGKVENDDNHDWSKSYSLFPGNVVYIWHAGKYAKQLLEQLEKNNYQVINQIIWVKKYGFNRGDYHHFHEPCIYAVKKGRNHNWQGSRKEKTVWEISNQRYEEGHTAHSTQKPVACMEKPIINNSARLDSVYDPFLGSGTTLIAAQRTNRICYGIEISPAYCDVIVTRWVEWMKANNQTPVIKRNGEIIEWDSLNE